MSQLRPSRTRLAAVLAILATCAVAIGSQAQTMTEGNAVLIQEGNTPALLMLYTGDVIGYVSQCGCKKNPAGGLARRAWVVEEITNKFPQAPTLLLDSGNWSDNPTPQGDVKTKALLAGMAQMGYAAVNVGERDVKMGYDFFAKRTADAQLNFTSANIVRQDTQEPIFEPHVVVEANSSDGSQKQRIGVIGVARYNPIFLNGGPNETNMVIAHPVERVKKEIAALQEKGIEHIVLLAALHKDDARRIAREAPGIDVIVGSYGGDYTVRAEAEEDTLIVYSGNQGKRIGETRLVLGADGAVQAQYTQMHFLTAAYPSHPEMEAFVDELPIAGTTTSGLRPDRPVFVGTDQCMTCHDGVYRQWQETPHALAYETLAEQGKHEEAGCRTCHVTGSQQPGGFKNLQTTPGLAHVGCESCHGAGSTHVTSNLAPYGRMSIDTCTSCHDVENSPEFDYYAYLPQVTHSRRASR